MAINQNTKVYLLDVPLENDYKHTLYFENETKQKEYFNSKIKHSYTDFTYQRKDNLIYIPASYEEVCMCNYVMYENTSHNWGKWYYCFIKDIRYENEECTIIEIETDVLQTWMFDYTIKPSFVEREHVKDDTFGKHTVPENLETGDFICNKLTKDDKLNNLAIYIAFSDYPKGENSNIDVDVVGNIYTGIYSGMAYRIFPYNSTGVTDIMNFLDGYDEDAKAEAINSLFIGPSFLAFDDSTKETFESQQLTTSGSPRSYTKKINRLNTVDSYTPKNKKVLTYPYTYLLVSNNNGGTAIYKNELFTSSEYEFNVKGTITPGCSIRMYPLSYNGCNINYDEGINAGKYPICCWNSDTYTNWLTQNGQNISMTRGASALSILGGIVLTATGNPMMGMGMIGGGVMGIANSCVSVAEHSLVPDQVKGNINCGDVITADRDNCFMFYQMSIKKEYARIVDNYFDLFGYKINVVKIPEKNHRSRYWYTKTIDINIDGSIPQNDLQKIKNCYDNGITFWKDKENICVYPTIDSEGNVINANNIV